MAKRRNVTSAYQDMEPGASKLISGESGWGADTAFALRIAAEKAILLAEAKKRFSNHFRLLKEDSGDGKFSLLESLCQERAKAKDKYDMRLREAQNHADAGMVISLTDPEIGQIIGEGRLIAIDVGKATLSIVQGDRKPQEFTYTRPLPVPEDLREHQTFYGMEQLLDIDVLAVPEDTAWVFRY